MKIAAKITSLSVGSILFFAVVSYLSLQYTLRQSSREQLQETSATYLQEKKNYLHDLVNSAYLVAERTAALYPDDPKKAQELARELICAIRFQDNSGYFYAYQKNPDGTSIIAFHGTKREFWGKPSDLITTDIKGFNFRDPLIANADAGKTEFVEYYFEKPTTREVVKKLAFAKKFAPWNWYISGGIYVDDIQKNLDKQSAFLNAQMAGISVQSLVISLIILAVATVIALVVSRGIARPMIRAVDVAEAISQGDFSRTLEANGKDETAAMARAVNRIPEVLNGINLQFEQLARAAESGDLSFRTDNTGLQGAYRRIIDTVNMTLDNVVRPINLSMNTLGKLSCNDLTEKVDTTGLRGDYQRLADSVNTLRERLLHLQDTAIAIAEGDLSPLEEYIQTGKRSENDRLVPAYIRMMQAIKALIEEVGEVARAASAGDLSARAATDRHTGAYGEVAAGFNQTLDAISKPLEEVAEVLNDIARNRDLTRRVTGLYRGDLEKLKENVNRTVESMDSAIGRVSEVANQVNAGAVQIADASQTMAQGATEQASSLEEIGSSIVEISSQTGNNAESAGEANRLVKQTLSSANDGNEHMQQMKAAMNEINEATTQIAKINKLIDDIAFQTNLLALNAAVEAARAGIHGKGFAVVAGEVRNLAGRSAAAAAEATEKIETAGQRVGKGLEAVELTARSFASILEDINKVSILAGDIAQSSQEQKKGIEGVNQGLGQIDQVTQQNAAAGEQTAAASEELSGQATNLMTLIHEFKVTESSGYRLNA